MRCGARLALGSAVALAVCSCVDREAAGKGSLAGCYDLELGPWKAPDALRSDSIDFEPPPRILLDSNLIREGPDSGRYPLRTAPRSVPSVHAMTAWQPMGHDTVSLVWSTGFVGLTAVLVRDGEVLRGQAETFTDVVPDTSATRTVVARPADCESPPPHPAWASRKLFRRIVSDEGDTVTLGVPFRRPDGKVTDRAGASVKVRGRWGTAKVRLDLEQGDTVTSISFYYPDGTDHARIARYFAQKLGPPTWQSESTPIPAMPNTRPRRITAWRARDTEFVISGEEQVIAWVRDPRRF